MSKLCADDDEEEEDLGLDLGGVDELLYDSRDFKLKELRWPGGGDLGADRPRVKELRWLGGEPGVTDKVNELEELEFESVEGIDTAWVGDINGDDGNDEDNDVDEEARLAETLPRVRFLGKVTLLLFDSRRSNKELPDPSVLLSGCGELEWDDLDLLDGLGVLDPPLPEGDLDLEGVDTIKIGLVWLVW